MRTITVQEANDTCRIPSLIAALHMYMYLLMCSVICTNHCRQSHNTTSSDG